MEWRLFSPSAKPLTCAIEPTPEGFTLRVLRGASILFTANAPDPDPLRARAAAWRKSLERNGYAPRPVTEGGGGGRPSEIRSALIGLIECAAILELHNRADARAVRNDATAGLAAAALRDTPTLTASVMNIRANLSRIDAPSGSVGDLLASALALVDRIEATPEFRAGGGT